MTEVQTPAMTANKDLKKYRPGRVNYRRRKVNRRAKEIQDSMVIAENLIELAKTDRDAAYERFAEIRQIAKAQAKTELPPIRPKPKSKTDQKRFARARVMRGKAQLWDTEYAETFDAQIEQSAESTHERVADDREVINWLIGCIPTVAEFTGVDGKTEFDDNDVVEENGGTVKLKDKYASVVNGFRIFINKWQSVVDNYEEELELNDVDPMFDIVNAVEGLGLVQCYEESDDGYLWFKPEGADGVPDSQLYFISLIDRVLAIGSKGLSVLDSARVKDPRESRIDWAANWHVDLTHTAIGWQPGSFKALARICSDYFGAWDRLRKWIAISVESGNAPPPQFPSELAERE